ncbi:uncharacterized protein F5147DRAFT_687029 [Suillus discolor]|uniref:Secreted protein n=1 Tax=Suillus discolor TaxID=1912936 RepID=A0A9P7FAT2_9AGAM|nr:uncharacterized protein F5147DRAFT_687029 [Suillus discolor]KAG2111272.1 hypothetical protein F5147DRAFT_687029 [Suillus discolor]
MFTIRFTLRAYFLATRIILPTTTSPASATAFSNPVSPDPFRIFYTSNSLTAFTVSASSPAERTIPPISHHHSFIS